MALTKRAAAATLGLTLVGLGLWGAFLFGGDSRGDAAPRGLVSSSAMQGPQAPRAAALQRQPEQALVELPRAFSSESAQRAALPELLPTASAEALAGGTLTLRVQAMWGSEAPIAHQGFQVLVRALPGEEAPGPRPSVAAGRLSFSHLGGSERAADPSLPGGAQSAATDALGRVVFENLPAGMVELQPLGNGLFGPEDIRRFELLGNQDYLYEAPPGLAFGGQLYGPIAPGLQARLRLFNFSGQPGTLMRYVLSPDGRFLFRGLVPGHYQLELYDEARWEVIEKYPAFELSQDLLDASYDVPSAGSLTVQVRGLPQGTELLGSYVRRLDAEESDRERGVWFFNDEYDAQSCRFESLPYGEYVLYLRAEGQSLKDAGADTIACLPLRIDRREVSLEWTHVQPQKLWVRIRSASPTLDRMAQIEARIRFLRANEDGSLRIFSDSEREELRDLEASKSRLQADPGRAELSSHSLRGDLAITNLSNGVVHRQPFTMDAGRMVVESPRQMNHLAAPFRNRVPRLKQGALEWMTPLAPGAYRLAVRSEGFQDSVLEFEHRGEEVLEAELKLIGEGEPGE